MNGRAEIPKRKSSFLLILIVGISVFLSLAAGMFAFLLSPYAIREIWIPIAARSADVSIHADELYVESLFPFRLKARNLCYSDSETAIKIHSAVSGIRIGKLKKRILELTGTKIDGIRVVCHPQKSKITPAVPGPEKKNEFSAEDDGADPWIFIMREFELENAVLELENRKRKTVQTWSAKSMKGNQFLAGEWCRLTAEASVLACPDERNPLSVRALPFHFQAEYRMDSAFRLKEFKIGLETGICDLSITEEIVIPARAGISGKVKLEGSFTDPDTLWVKHSETCLFKNGKNIGRLLFKGSFGQTFQCEGSFFNLNMEPFLSILAPDSQVRLDILRADFTGTGRDFTPESIRRDLKARLYVEMKDFSVPFELDRQNRIIRLIMIPVEAMPSLVEMLHMKWNLNREINRCLNTVKSVISGKQNLNFDRAKLDVVLEDSILKIKDITLHGRDIEMESIRGTLDVVTEKLDIQTVLAVGSIKLPLKFEGTLNNPSPIFRDAVQDFLLLNAPLLEKLEKLLTDPPSKKDTRLEKAIKRGYRDFNRFLK